MQTLHLGQHIPDSSDGQRDTLRLDFTFRDLLRVRVGQELLQEIAVQESYSLLRVRTTSAIRRGSPSVKRRHVSTICNIEWTLLTCYELLHPAP